MKRILIEVIGFYKKFISPVFEALFGKACRFAPSCSEYTIMALKKYGTVRGLSLGMRRFLKCHPFGPSGYDPIPESI